METSRSQPGSAGSWASPFNPVAEARTRLPRPPPALRAPPEEPNQQLPHCQPGDQRCHRLPPPSPGKPSSRAGLGARHRAATRAWAEPVSPAAPPRQPPSPEPRHGSSSSQAAAPARLPVPLLLEERSEGAQGLQVLDGCWHHDARQPGGWHPGRRHLATRS